MLGKEEEERDLFGSGKKGGRNQQPLSKLTYVKQCSVRCTKIQKSPGEKKEQGWGLAWES